jgi:hypothetical protein
MATLLEEDKISIDALFNILKSASLDAQVVGDEIAVRVNPSDPRAVSITMDKPNHLLKLLVAAGPLGGKDQQKDEFVNRLNFKELMPSFYWSSSDDQDPRPWVTAKYYMSIAGGLIDEQFVSILRRFATEFTDGITKYDTDSLIMWDDGD